MRVLFLGNHTVGVRTLEALEGAAELVGVVAHPRDPEDGLAYQSVGGWAERRGLPLLRAAGRDAALADFAAQLAPDLLWIADYRYLLPRERIESAPLGAFNLHPSLLPAYRGRAPINWAILRGERELGLTLHRVDAGVDTGEILLQARYHLASHEDVGDALHKLYPLYAELTREGLARLERGTLRGRAQEHTKASLYPRRRPEDGRIDWRRSVEEVHNLVRAVARPYPGAFSSIDGQRLSIWKAERDARAGAAAPGTVLERNSRGIKIACGRGALLATEYELAADARLAEGARCELVEAA